MKSISGRKFSTMALISTYCFVIVGSVVLAMMKLMDIPTLLALISGLGTLVMYVVKAYYDDKDRSLENNGTNKPT